MPRNIVDWNDETIALLRELWSTVDETGRLLSTPNIGRRMGISKDAVVGKAHRLNLPARPEFQQRKLDDEKEKQVRALLAIGHRPAEVARAARVHIDTVRKRLVEKNSSDTCPTAPQLETPTPAAQARTFRTHACLWPLGDPGTPNFRFCDGNTIPGKPYCAEHAAVAYIKVRDKREEVRA